MKSIVAFFGNVFGRSFTLTAGWPKPRADLKFNLFGNDEARFDHDMKRLSRV